jgi:ribonuclease P protein component
MVCCRVNALSLPKSNRVLKSAEFKQVYQTGTRMTSRYFAAFCLCAPDAALPARFGFTVPRAVGKAVVRNRLKRRMREAIRRHFANLPDNCSIVFNPRRNVLEAPFNELCQEIGRILLRCKQL